MSMTNVFPGKGKTPLRRSNHSALSEAAAVPPVVPVVERSCDKSCQVTSEQIKADMKAAAENAKRSSSKCGTPDVVQSSARTGTNSGAVWGTGGAGGPARTRAKPVAGAVGRAGPGGATTKQAAGGCGSTAAGIDTGVRQSSAGGASPNSTAAPGSHDSRRTALPAEQEDRQTSRSGGNQHNHGPRQDFVPRRPLTRSRTRLSSVPLAPETGKGEAADADVQSVEVFGLQLRQHRVFIRFF